MKFDIEAWNLDQLITLYKSGSLNLNPPYQRGDIWSPSAKRKLIDSIKLFYPLPAFFIFENEKEQFEMVDGQQRTRAILGYHNGYFSDENKITIHESDKNLFYQKYKIAVYKLTDATKAEVEDFYYRVNKFGTKLNRAEISRAHFSSTPQQRLVEKLADNADFASLQLFTESSLNRLNDTDLIAELLTLQLLGNTDKKIQVDKKFYEDDNFTDEQARDLEGKFVEVLVHLQRFNSIYPIKKTRYRQRNDIYTLYGFLKDNVDLDADTLDYFYKILVLIGEDINPSNEKCFSFKEYADNCVSQSNSKKARDARSGFMKNLLLNKDEKPLSKSEEDETANLVMMDTLNFYNLENNDLLSKSEYWVVDVQSLQEATNKHYF